MIILVRYGAAGWWRTGGCAVPSSKVRAVPKTMGAARKTSNYSVIRPSVLGRSCNWGGRISGARHLSSHSSRRRPRAVAASPRVSDSRSSALNWLERLAHQRLQRTLRIRTPPALGRGEDLRFRLLGRQLLIRGGGEHLGEHALVIAAGEMLDRRSPSSAHPAWSCSARPAHSRRPPRGRDSSDCGRSWRRASDGSSRTPCNSARSSEGGRRAGPRGPGEPRACRRPGSGRASGSEQRSELGLWKPGEFSELPPDQRAQNGRGDLVRIGARGRHQRRATFGVVWRVLGGELAPAGTRTGAWPPSIARSNAALPWPRTKSSGSSPSGQEQEARFLAVRQHRQRVLQRAPGGLASGAVAVEAEDHQVGQPEQLLRVDRRRRRAERRHRVVDAVLRERHDVHVAFDDQHPAGVADRVARKIEAVELSSLREERRFRRVEVLWLAVVEHAAAEADHAAAGIVDREHHAVAKAVVALAALAAR